MLYKTDLDNLENGVFISESARAVNQLDDSSVYRAMRSTPFSRSHVPELYPGLGEQADELIQEFGGTENVHVISYSNGGPKHQFLNETRGLGGTSIDPMMGPLQSSQLVRGNRAPMEYLTTDSFSVMDTAINLAPHFGTNVHVQYVPHVTGTAAGTLPNIARYGMANHDLDGPFSENTDKSDTGKITTNTDLLKAGAHAFKGAVTGLASGAIVHGIAPNMNREATTAATAGTNLVLDSGVAAGYTGIMARSAGQVLSTAGKSMGEGALPMLAAYEAADHFGDLMDLISNGGYSANVSAPIKIADTIGVAGGAGAASLAAQRRALQLGGKVGSKAMQAIRVLRAGRAGQLVSEGAEGIEGVEGAEAGAEIAGEGLEIAGEGAEVVGEGVELAGGATATFTAMEETALATATAPVPGARPVSALIAMAGLVVLSTTLITTTIAQMFSPHDTPEQTEEKRKLAQKILEDKYASISAHYIKKQEEREIDPNNYTSLKPEDVLTAGEIEFMNRHQPKYFDAIEEHLHAVWQVSHNAHVQYQQQVNQLAQHYGVSELTIETDLNNVNTGTLSMEDFDKKYYHIEASQHGLSDINYNVQQQLQPALDAGYTSRLDYDRSFKDGADNIHREERQFANKYNKAEHEAEDAGYYTIDEYQYRNNMTQWTPQVSQILKAHSLGYTLAEFNEWMEQKGAGSDNAYNSSFTAQQISDQRVSDDLHFTDELMAAGYDVKDYQQLYYSGGHMHTAGMIEDRTGDYAGTQDIINIFKDQPKSAIDASTYINPNNPWVNDDVVNLGDPETYVRTKLGEDSLASKTGEFVMQNDHQYLANAAAA